MPDCLVGVNPECDCIVAVTSLDAEYISQALEHARRWEQRGLRIETRTEEQIRVGKLGCEHKKERTL